MVESGYRRRQKGECLSDRGYGSLERRHHFACVEHLRLSSFPGVAPVAAGGWGVDKKYRLLPGVYKGQNRILTSSSPLLGT